MTMLLCLLSGKKDKIAIMFKIFQHIPIFNFKFNFYELESHTPQSCDFNFQPHKRDSHSSKVQTGDSLYQQRVSSSLWICRLCGDKLDPEHPDSLNEYNPETKREAWMHFWCLLVSFDDLEDMESSNVIYFDKQDEYLDFSEGT